jgi:hypothetical protein
MPIELAALYATKEDVELLFPFTSPIPDVADWSVDGIINHAKLEHMQLMVCSCGKNNCLLLMTSNFPMQFCSNSVNRK